ncbi:MAG: sulfur transfer protein involved in thiamine biosynthesis [Gracilibacter sp. BRH_c7a]|nr:MAG: sulfur transfer protein involved in thiamine biosynthesis [Gracilibacter sp. BRH_c7a]
MQITFNGKKTSLEKEMSVKELLVTQKVEMPEYVTVQINDELIDREDFEILAIREGDEIEFLYFMGGGTL